MAKNGAHAHSLACYAIWPFMGKLGCNFYRSSRDHYPSIGDEKSKL